MKPAVSVKQVAKRYRLGEVGIRSLKEDVNRLWRQIRGETEEDFIADVNDRTTTTGSNFVWALHDVSFDVYPGESVGLIGRNGSGKSTMLKLLSRITGPTIGEIGVRGRVASLLEVGTGFHQDLTGLENIYLNGAILGMSRSETRSRLEEIIAFSGCERYVDTPVKRYSTGMQVRLGFAVAAHLNADILIIDEVLAVGDYEFQRKCLDKLKEIATSGKTVFFVSHNMDAVAPLCTRTIVLDRGQVAHDGATDQAIRTYRAEFSDDERTNVFLNPEPENAITGIRVSDARVMARPETGKPFEMQLDVEANLDHPVTAPVSVSFRTPEGHPLMRLSSEHTGKRFTFHKGTTTVKLCCEELPLMGGLYNTILRIGTPRSQVVTVRKAINLEVTMTEELQQHVNANDADFPFFTRSSWTSA